MGILTLKNKNGEVVTGFPRLRKKEYGTGAFYSNDIRRPRPDYINWLQNSDRFGFDVTRLNENGLHLSKIELPYGTKLIRYGSATGRYTAPKGTCFEELSLPWDEQTCEYHEYVVVADRIKVICVVLKGFVAPGFECIGGGIQYLHDITMLQSINRGILKEVTTWK
ncbi:MAG: TNT domain-containing protein [Clostridia bacterium]|nr:TNT domain-containing protein [Clostridia bacterium]